jgi:K+-sensing histidine kinase KdpD
VAFVEPVQPDAREVLNSVIANLSRRNQALIHYQLAVLADLEKREADPVLLAKVFKLDHLATRMRRYGDNLMIFAGEDSASRWSEPVSLVEVLRAAASEVEQYERIELASLPSIDVVGNFANDLVHLLAELLDNATSFSAPHTTVRIVGHALPDGRVLVNIDDTGMGISPDGLAEINKRLANRPMLDVGVSYRMGIFVIGQLSARCGIRIQLRPGRSGGTTALVMLPINIIHVAEQHSGS